MRSQAKGRESFYEIREVLMRFCLEVKKQRDEPIQLVVEFLRWYRRDELLQRLEMLPPDAIEREYVQYALGVKEESKVPRIAALMEDYDIQVLDDALNRFAHANEPETGNTKAIISNLFNSSHDAAIWNSRIKTLIEIYNKHQIISALGQGLVRSIPVLMSEMVSDKAAQTWLEVWQKLVGDRPEFQIPLRLLNAAIRYRETKGDRRVLLDLPIEERNLLKPLLGI